MHNWLTKTIKVVIFTVLLIVPVFVFAADRGIEIIIGQDNLRSVSSTRWQEINRILDPFGNRQCGDGVLQSGEQCDPPNRKVSTGNSCGPKNNGLIYKTCNSNCQLEGQGTCRAANKCGNGIVEKGEDCDDGDLNGTYGNCANDCQGRFDKYCGDGSLNINNNGNPLEVCDDERGVCQNDNLDNYETHIIVPRQWASAHDLQLFNWRKGDILKNIPSAPKAKTTFQVYPSVGSYQSDAEICKAKVLSLKEFKNLTSPSQKKGSRYQVDPLHIALERLIELVESGKVFSSINDKDPEKILLITNGHVSDFDPINNVSVEKVCNSGLELKKNTNSHVNQLKSSVKEKLKYINQKLNIPVEIIHVRDSLHTSVPKKYLNELGEIGLNTPQKDKKFHEFDSGNSIKNILSCSTYSFNSYASCSSDCQSPGGYCGDGKVNINSPEECDDGNNNNNDSCTNACKLNELNQPVTSGPAQCGDGQRQEGERCDLGDQNGIRCQPKYGESCTYCSADCSQVLTVDPVNYCGDGEIDKTGTSTDGTPTYEACEVKNGEPVYNNFCATRISDTTKAIFKNLGAEIEGDYAFSSIPCNSNSDCGTGLVGRYSLCINKSTPKVVNCPDKGSYQCQASCTNLSENCVECGRYDGRDSIPTLAVLNPMIAGHESEYYSGPNPASKWGTDGDGRTGTSVGLYRVSAAGEDNLPDLPNRVVGEMGSSSPASEGKCTTGNCNYHLPNEYKPIFSDSNKQSINDASIESDSMCNDEYSIYFNANKLLEGDYWSPSSLVSTAELYSSATSDRKGSPGSAFDYPVKGESGQIKNSVIASPPLPPEYIRIVVKWTWGKDDSDNFAVRMLSPYIEEYDSIEGKVRPEEDRYRSFMRAGFGGPLTQAVTTNTEIRTINTNSKAIGKQDYWMPALPVSRLGIDNFNNGKEDIEVKGWIHDIGGTSDGSQTIQSMTVELPSNTSTYPVYISKIGQPIQPHQNSDNLEVLVYTGKNIGDGGPWKNPSLNSVYKPDYRFKIKNANHSSNPLAGFWHVFNIKEGKILQSTDTGKEVISKSNGGVKNHGQVITRFCELQEVADPTQLYCR